MVFKLTNGAVTDFSGYINGDYGSYDYEVLGIKPYVQTHCQMSRNGQTICSSLYRDYILKNVTKGQSICDFGAGKKFYINMLKNKGFEAYAYEPFYKEVGTERLDINTVVSDINSIQKRVERSGLFDVVVLDSVLNSITSAVYEDYVLTCCNALLKPNGTFYVGTSNKMFSDRTSNLSQMTNNHRYIEFMDNENYSATFRKGVWTLQKFHTQDSLRNLLENYFEEVNVIDKAKSQLWEICTKPIKLSKKNYFEALNAEFNLEYSQNYRHNKQKKDSRNYLK